ncbi:MAG: sensor histidine kinase [Methylococcaceae bacterium]
MKPVFYRPAQLRGLVFLGLVLLALGILGGMIGRNLHHFQSALSYVNYSHRIQKVSAGLQQLLIGYLTESVPLAEPAALTRTLTEIDGLIADNRYLSATTRVRLETVKNILIDLDKLEKHEKNAHLIKVLKIMSETLDYEILQREKLLEDINLDTQNELYVALATFTLILLGAVLFLHFRILHPLNDLRQLLERLTEENFTPITTDHLDPLLLPVFDSYNEMVTHLAELEEANRLHAQSLRYEVKLATQALLEQQYSLARAERLAAIGEVAAELAHEIRNPLAGIQMAFSNLRREIDNQGQCQRMEMISAELKRLARFLNDMLDQSRHSPEAASDFDVTKLIRELLVLVRYQIAESIELQIDAPTSLPVHLPESGARQLLLNLILNAADALEGNAGLIIIRARSENGGLQLVVQDNGPGFSSDMLEQGIRPFRTSRQRGTGLGLAMAQRFVKEMDGAIKLTNQSPHGACVSIWLPNSGLSGIRK